MNAVLSGECWMLPPVIKYQNYHLHPFHFVLFKVKDLVAKQHPTNTHTHTHTHSALLLIPAVLPQTVPLCLPLPSSPAARVPSAVCWHGGSREVHPPFHFIRRGEQRYPTHNGSAYMIVLFKTTLFVPAGKKDLVNCQFIFVQVQ